jgi:hypothetical protein
VTDRAHQLPGWADAYAELADVYAWLVPEALLTPDGTVAAFSEVVDRLEPGARVLDCAAGTGQLAVGLALAGFRVTSSSRSAADAPRMISWGERDIGHGHAGALDAEHVRPARAGVA